MPYKIAIMQYVKDTSVAKGMPFAQWMVCRTNIYDMSPLDLVLGRHLNERINSPTYGSTQEVNVESGGKSVRLGMEHAEMSLTM